MSHAVERTIGRLLRPFSAGESKLLWNDPKLAGIPATIRLTSPAFDDSGRIPPRHAGRGLGDNLSPPLAWANLPDGTAELLLILQDPDAPLPRPVTHLVARILAPQQGTLAEGALAPQGDRKGGDSGTDPAVVLGRGSFGRTGYAGPRPPRGHGMHRYIFQIYAAGAHPALPDRPGLTAIHHALHGRILARGKLTGTFQQV